MNIDLHVHTAYSDDSNIRIGQLLNVVSVANDVGVTSKTIKHWISILEASFVIIPPLV